PGDTEALHALLRDLHTLKGGARMAEIRPVGDLAHELEFLYEGLVGGRFDLIEGLPELLMACHDALADMVEGVLAGRAVSDGMALTRALREFRAAPEQVPLWLEEGPAPITPSGEPEPAAPAAVSGMLGMFIEEARELLHPCAALLARLPDEPEAAAQILHRVEALKGTARLAGQDSLAEQARELERAL